MNAEDVLAAMLSGEVKIDPEAYCAECGLPLQVLSACGFSAPDPKTLEIGLCIIPCAVCGIPTNEIKEDFL